MHMRFRGRRASKGDTIVEVLIAVAVVSVVITSAYLVANRSTNGIQGAQEQSYAQKLVEQQTELLRSAASLPTTSGCYDTSASPPLYVVPSGYYNPCLVANGGATYTIAIEPPSGTQTSFAVKVSWDTVSGQSAHVTAYYKGASAP